MCVYAWRQDGLGLYISLVHGVPSGCRVCAYVCMGIDVDLMWLVCVCLCVRMFGACAHGALGKRSILLGLHKHLLNH